MTAPYDERALWLKAKLFLNHAMDEEEPRTFDERALWASLALELLAKASLARVSPLLIASPTEEGTNLLIASGLVEGQARLNSVKAHTLYSRCHQAFRPFNEKEAQTITWARNEYLHGGSAVFTAIPADAWWPRYWAQAFILVNAQDKVLEELVGLDRVPVVEGHLAKNRKNIEHRAEMLISRAQQRLAQHRSGDLPAKLANKWASSTDLTVGLSHRAEASCPACGAMGTIEGEEIEKTEPRYEQVAEDDFEAWVELSVGTDYFSCPTCRLVLDSWDLINVTELPPNFADTGDYGDYAEPEYGND